MTEKQRREASIERNAIASLHAEVKRVRSKAAKEIKRLRAQLAAERALAAAREEKHRREMEGLDTRRKQAEARQRVAEKALASAESRLEEAALLTTALLESNQMFVERAENASICVANFEQLHPGQGAQGLEKPMTNRAHRQPPRKAHEQSRQRAPAVTEEPEAEPEYFIFDAPAEPNLLPELSQNSLTSQVQPDPLRLTPAPETKKEKTQKKQQPQKDSPRLTSDKTDEPAAEQQAGSLIKALKIALGIGAGIGGAAVGLKHLAQAKTRDSPRLSTSKGRQPTIEKPPAAKKLPRSGS